MNFVRLDLHAGQSPLHKNVRTNAALCALSVTNSSHAVFQFACVALLSFCSMECHKKPRVETGIFDSSVASGGRAVDLEVVWQCILQSGMLCLPDTARLSKTQFRTYVLPWPFSHPGVNEVDSDIQVGHVEGIVKRICIHVPLSYIEINIL